ncbi:hypothetical protein B0T22DRAFT_276945 [Podospora appendiculata]|uniref:Uncharacterized protein n=1 Tax=Podospora appendiculata TaxID=314037 RepID=A0AAE1C7W2_9PEZI|nr:hypothetical protein B0T22DRAFT_276945 [Podospora appendiculata]
MSVEATELLDAFRAAALSVTKLYKTSASAQAKARADGYQDCLDDLLVFLDKEKMGMADGEGWQIRRWATERLEGRDTISQTVESEEEENDKPEPASSPVLHRSNSVAPLPAGKHENSMRDSAPPPATAPVQPTTYPVAEESEMVAPSMDQFTFQSSHPYPQDAYMNLANLDLSDSQKHNTANRTATATGTTRGTRVRNGRVPSRAAISRVAGQKRKLGGGVNLAEIFDLDSLGHGNGKDVFGGGGKRSRHA